MNKMNNERLKRLKILKQNFLLHADKNSLIDIVNVFNCEDYMLDFKAGHFYYKLSNKEFLSHRKNDLSKCKRQIDVFYKNLGEYFSLTEGEKLDFLINAVSKQMIDQCLEMGLNDEALKLVSLRNNFYPLHNTNECILQVARNYGTLQLMTGTSQATNMENLANNTKDGVYGKMTTLGEKEIWQNYLDERISIRGKIFTMEDYQNLLNGTNTEESKSSPAAPYEQMA